MRRITFDSVWKIEDGKFFDSDQEQSGSVLALDGISDELAIKEINALDTVNATVDRLLSLSNSWSVVYYRADLNYVFIGRDVFGRTSLVWTKTAENSFIFSSSVKTLNKTWYEVPYGQVTAIDISKMSATMTSLLPEYPEDDGSVVAWRTAFSCFESFHAALHQELITLKSDINASDVDYCDAFLSRLDDVITEFLADGSSEVAIAFSGGVDSLLVAHRVLKVSPANIRIFLVNVAFGTEEAWGQAPDRIRALALWPLLQNIDIHKQLHFIHVNVTPAELEETRKDFVCKATAPAVSVLDDSLACVLWFALRAKGVDFVTGNHLKVTAQTFFVGSGADELFAGYARHRTRYEKDGIHAVVNVKIMAPENIFQECQMELRRLGSRNGGRDARVAKQLSRTLAAPFLADKFVKWANSIPITDKCDLSLPRGEGEKKIIRDSLKRLELPHDAPKQAMQFGSRMAKMTNSNKQIKGSDVSEFLKPA